MDPNASHSCLPWDIVYKAIFSSGNHPLHFHNVGKKGLTLSRSACEPCVLPCRGILPGRFGSFASFASFACTLVRAGVCRGAVRGRANLRDLGTG